MSFDVNKLYDLLPAIYRIRDQKVGEPVKDVLSVIAEEIAIIEEDLAQLYDNQFIETCADWSIPYIGDLIGYRPLNGKVPEIISPRAEVANTITYRRRKGTATVLEELAKDVTGWDTRVVEFFKLMATTQYMNHIRLENLQTPDLRRLESLKFLNTPFDTLAHLADVHNISSTRGRFNIPNIGIFLWRLYPFSITNSPALWVKDRSYFFSPLGNNMQLFTRPKPEDEITHLAEPINVPMPINRQLLNDHIDDYYGPDKSLLIRVDGNDISKERIVVCNLSDWHLHNDKYAIDPVLGRITLPENSPSKVYVNFHYGFSMEMGGGEYKREPSFGPFDTIKWVYKDHTDTNIYPTVQKALNALSVDGTVEITQNEIFRENLGINAVGNQKIELRTRNECRPIIEIFDENLTEELPTFRIKGGMDAEVTLNGLVITNGVLKVSGIRRLTLRHCTLVPGLALKQDGTPKYPDESSLIVESADTDVNIDHSILGALRVPEGAKVQISNSIVDSLEENRVAYASIDGSGAGGDLNINNSTVIGRVRTELMRASNTIFMAKLAHSDLAYSDEWTAPVISERSQEGCVRFSYVPFRSKVPRRYYCQPGNQGDSIRMRPQFTSLQYGNAGYCQLSRNCALEILEGADDEAEMGVFHDLYQPQRITNLRVRLDEYLRFGLEAGIFCVS